jgi:hypothetical protein
VDAAGASCVVNLYQRARVCVVGKKQTVCFGVFFPYGFQMMMMMLVESEVLLKLDQDFANTRVRYLRREETLSRFVCQGFLGEVWACI